MPWVSRKEQAELERRTQEIIQGQDKFAREVNGICEEEELQRKEQEAG